jgi:ribosome-binding protein aMBF1 (putative translation factor)
MDNQDWNPVMIHGTSKSIGPKPQVCIKNQCLKQVKQLDEATDAGKLKQLNIQDRQILISMRASRGLKQDQLAQAISMPANLYKDIESGKAIPTQQQLNKINNYLKTNVKLN